MVCIYNFEVFLLEFSDLISFIIFLLSAIAIHVVVYMGNFGGCTRLLKLREGAFGGGDAFLILCFYTL